MQDIWEKNRNSKILIAGPCVIESLDLCLEIAFEIKRVSQLYSFNPIFKASYDKANRTSTDGFRGVGIITGLDILEKVKKATDMPIITDVHEVSDVSEVSKVVDFLQVPAFLSRQTDLIIACAKSKLPTVVKKGQFLSPEACKYIEEKFYKAGGTQMMICERGNSFGYNDLIVDVTSLPRLKNACTNSKVIMDCTHSLQKPTNGTYGKTGGRSDLIEEMVKYASVMNADGLFIEVHPEPKKSPSDSENMLNLKMLDKLIYKSRKIYNCEQDD